MEKYKKFNSKAAPMGTLEKVSRFYQPNRERRGGSSDMMDDEVNVSRPGVSSSRVSSLSRTQRLQSAVGPRGVAMSPRIDKSYPQLGKIRTQINKLVNIGINLCRRWI